MGAFWKYTVILLFSSNLYGQGLAVMGSIASSSETELPSFTIYKFVDYSTSSVVNALNPEANTQAMWDSPIFQSGGSVNNDSIIIVDSDTVGLHAIPLPSGSTALGVSTHGSMRINGVDLTGDTLINIYLTRWEKRSANWNYSKGGKAPGLAGVKRGTAGITNDLPVGGMYKPDCADPPYTDAYTAVWGFSARTMWNPEGQVYRDDTTGNPSDTWLFDDFDQYLYHHNLPWIACVTNETYGDKPINDGLWPSDIWIKVTQHIVMNTNSSPGVGNNDGYIELMRNDTVVHVLENMRLRNYDDVYVDYLFIYSVTNSIDDPGRTQRQQILYDDWILWTDFNSTPRSLGDVIQTPSVATDNRDYN